MTRSKLIYIAAALAFATCLLHLVGTFLPIPPEQTAVQEAVTTMNATLVSMPVGSAKSYMQILNGNNFGTALLLLICALQLLVIAKSPTSRVSNRTIVVAGIGLGGFALISVTHFFPIPALFTGVAAIICFVAITGRFERSAESSPT